MKDKAKRLNPLIALLTMAAWFAVSNHCALGGLESSKVAVASLNTCCHGGAHSPAKGPPKGDEKTCCKTLRALAIKPAASFCGTFGDTSKPFSYLATTANILPDHIALELRPQETGPPGRVTLAELVLQRSLLSHAPPLFA